MNPTEIVARLRTIVLRIGFLLGGLILLVELWRWLVSPGGWKAMRLESFSPRALFAGTWPDSILDIWIIQEGLAEILALPAYLGFPVIGLLIAIAVYYGYTQVVVKLFHFLTWVFIKIFRVGAKQRRHIIVCTDGTWNYPEELEGGVIKSSNVYKFWDNLKGERRKFGELTVGADLVKHHRCEDGTLQVGLYYPGVGNPATYSSLGVIIGGAFGFGAKAIMHEAYRDIIRYYRPGDRITVVGFSRGAAIARWLASHVGKEGVLRAPISDTWLGRYVVGLLRALSIPFASRRQARVDFLGVWDTVASFGLAKNVLGIPFQRINLFKDFNVSRAVRKVVHLLAVDEQRDAFLPTPVEPPKPGSGPSDTMIEEVWFPGVHSNVGGGFLDDGLAMISLEYMTERFLEFFADDGVAVELHTTDFGRLEDNIRSPLRPSSGPIYEMEPRKLPEDAVLHDSVFKKMALTGKPVVNPEEAEKLEYTPPNVIDLMKRLEQREQDAGEYLDKLHRAQLISEPEHEGASGALRQACKLRTVPKVAGGAAPRVAGEPPPRQ